MNFRSPFFSPASTSPIGTAWSCGGPFYSPISGTIIYKGALPAGSGFETYGNHLVLYQNSTVGRHKDQIPVIGDRVVLYPNTAVIGRSVVGDDAVVSQGVSVVNKRVPANSIAFPAGAGELAFKPRPADLIGEYFRL